MLGDRALAAVRRQAVEAVAHEHVVDAVGGDREAVVAPQVPGDPRRAEVVGEPQVDDLLLDRLGVRSGVVLGTGAPVHEAGLAVRLVARAASCSRHCREIPKRRQVVRHVAALLGVLEHCELPLDVTLLLSHPRPLC